MFAFEAFLLQLEGSIVFSDGWSFLLRKIKIKVSHQVQNLKSHFGNFPSSKAYLRNFWCLSATWSRLEREKCWKLFSKSLSAKYFQLKVKFQGKDGWLRKECHYQQSTMILFDLEYEGDLILAVHPSSFTNLLLASENILPWRMVLLEKNSTNIAKRRIIYQRKVFGMFFLGNFFVFHSLLR